MSQAPKTDLARKLWETCPKCYGDLLADHDGGLYCPQGHYRAANATSLPPDVEAGQKLIADGGDRRKGGGFDCPVEGCDGSFGVEVFDDYGGSKVVTTCDHAVNWCAYCENLFPAGELVFYQRPDGIATDKPTPKVHLCEGCARANRAFMVPGWDL
jgi:ribosomal protein S27AE